MCGCILDERNAPLRREPMADVGTNQAPHEPNLPWPGFPLIHTTVKCDATLSVIV